MLVLRQLDVAGWPWLWVKRARMERKEEFVVRVGSVDTRKRVLV
jgi:hypothetical protein